MPEKEPTQSRWSAGDIVALKSGSPAMTVIEVKSNLVVCQWFDRSAAEFKTVTLLAEAVSPSTRPNIAYG